MCDWVRMYCAEDCLLAMPRWDGRRDLATSSAFKFPLQLNFGASMQLGWARGCSTGNNKPRHRALAPVRREWVMSRITRNRGGGFVRSPPPLPTPEKRAGLGFATGRHWQQVAVTRDGSGFLSFDGEGREGRSCATLRRHARRAPACYITPSVECNCANRLVVGV